MKITEFTKTFKYLRAKYNFTKTSLAKGLGVSTSYIIDLENGNRRPNEKITEALITFYNLDEQDKRLLYDAVAVTTNSLPYDVVRFLLTNPSELQQVISSMNQENSKTL